MYEVTSRKGGQRQQPYGRPSATVREVRDNSRTTMDLLDLHVHRLQKKKARGSDSEAKATANLMAAQQLSWILRRKKNAPWPPQKGPACGSRRRGRRGG